MKNFVKIINSIQVNTTVCTLQYTSKGSYQHHAMQLHRAIIIMQIVTHTTGIMLHSTGIISPPQRKNYKFGLTLTQS